MEASQASGLSYTVGDGCHGEEQWRGDLGGLSTVLLHVCARHVPRPELLAPAVGSGTEVMGHTVLQMLTISQHMAAVRVMARGE